VKKAIVFAFPGPARPISPSPCSEIVGSFLGLERLWDASGPGITLDEDPRAEEVSLYDLAATLDRPDTTLIWLDPSSPSLESTFSSFQHDVKSARVVVAITGQDPDTRRRLANVSLGKGIGSCEYVDVDPRFQNRDQRVNP